MANAVLAIDEKDVLLGTFFSICHEELSAFLNQNKINIDTINSDKLNSIFVSSVTANHPCFVFGAYSHGNSESLLKGARDPYISIALNGESFKNSFFYTFSCSSGNELGRDLITKNCLCFIGYKNDVAIWSTYVQPFVECANYGLILFYQGADTDSILNQMKEKYNEKIDAVYKTDYMIASILKDNRDALIKHGNTITIKNLA